MFYDNIHNLSRYQSILTTNRGKDTDFYNDFFFPFLSFPIGKLPQNCLRAHYKQTPVKVIRQLKNIIQHPTRRAVNSP